VFLIIFPVSVNIVMDVLQVSANLFRKRKKISVLFLDTSDEWNEIETLQDIIRFVTDLCVSGLIVEQGDYLLLHETLRFFEMVRAIKYLTEYCHL
jgi:tRNA A58 N-methylase Trm61